MKNKSPDDLMAWRWGWKTEDEAALVKDQLFEKYEQERRKHNWLMGMKVEADNCDVLEKILCWTIEHPKRFDEDLVDAYYVILVETFSSMYSLFSCLFHHEGISVWF